MEGNVVKAAWILGGSLIAGVVLAGAGLAVGGVLLMASTEKQFDTLSRRSADAVLHAPEHTKISIKSDEGTPIKLGFESKLPLALRAENSLDDNTGKRAAFEVDVRPNLQK